MQSNLVSPSSYRPRLQQRQAFFPLNHVEFRLGLFPLRIDPMPPMLFRIGSQRRPTNPLVFLRFTSHHRKVPFVHAPRLKQISNTPQRSRALRKQQYARGLRIEPMNILQKLQTPRPRPKCTPNHRRRNGELQIPRRLVPVIRNQHPPRRLINGQHGSVLIKDRNRNAVRQLNRVLSRHRGN